MKIAVTYENGEIFQHFGHTKAFKVYNTQDGQIISNEVISSEGSGHEALAGLLDGRDIDVLICGGIGSGAQAALTDVGVEVCAGQSGDTDEAVEAYLRGELINSGVNCHHHEEAPNEDGEQCGGHEGGCGGCHGGCHSKPLYEGPNAGKTCKVHYKGTFDDGSQFDSSYDRDQPLEFVCGIGMMIPGFDKAVATMEVGQTINIHLMPEEAYGPSDPNAIFTLAINMIAGAEDLEVGQQVYLQNSMGQPFAVKVIQKDETNITFDANHEMAGKELNFQIELLEAK